MVLELMSVTLPLTKAFLPPIRPRDRSDAPGHDSHRRVRLGFGPQSRLSFYQDYGPEAGLVRLSGPMEVRERVEIKVYGPGCARCEMLERMTFNVPARLDVTADVEKVTDLGKMAEDGVMMTPAPDVNGRLKCGGRLPTEAELAGWIKAADQG